MKGTTHLAIGAAIGLAAAAYYPFTLKHAALYVTVAGFSALSADLDGTSMLSSKLGKLSKLIRELLLWGGALLLAGVAYIYYLEAQFYKEYTIISVIVFLLGMVTKQGMIRNALVSAIGCILLYVGLTYAMNWLMGLGLFIAWVPWLNHRGMTHTVWAVLIWGAIGWGLEQQLQLEGITIVSLAGYVSHLVADTLTPSGVKWLYPLYKKSIKLPL
ncbi:metal-dependent hydrolase [Paenibacillus oenotherae]|uniref:Metal-dependent hydrolase n=2 Tax=Paenibacillus oenotherae TaxID=1435645 RepID=A0ABS7D000_9BACL|nr:metal-dependent hydrolase [Paenibacillus oenotherae]MBW7473128.1 metal-dependent hydrolase [Paenibacillus oenotherae]